MEVHYHRRKTAYESTAARRSASTYAGGVSGQTNALRSSFRKLRVTGIVGCSHSLPARLAITFFRLDCLFILLLINLISCFSLRLVLLQ